MTICVVSSAPPLCYEGGIQAKSSSFIAAIRPLIARLQAARGSRSSLARHVAGREREAGEILPIFPRPARAR
jgi:hypothetical protein